MHMYIQHSIWTVFYSVKDGNFVFLIGIHINYVISVKYGIVTTCKKKKKKKPVANQVRFTR